MGTITFLLAYLPVEDYKLTDISKLAFLACQCAVNNNIHSVNI